jgi:hypothetical protein
LACRRWFINNVLARPVCGKRKWGLRPDTQTTSQTAGLAGREQPADIDS